MCIRAYLQGMSPTEVIPSDLVEVWRYLEKAPTVIEFMTRSAFRRGAATALSLGLAHFPEDFDLDDVTSGYPSSTGSVEISEVLKLTDRTAVYSERVWAMGDLLPTRRRSLHLTTLSRSTGTSRSSNLFVWRWRVS